MHVILDTNIIYGEWKLDTTTFTLYFDTIANTRSYCYIPEIVYDETKNKFLEELRKLISQVNSGINKIKNITQVYNLSTIPENFLKDQCNLYFVQLDDAIKKHTIQILPYPITDHKKLVTKIFEQKKPFSTGEKGYRDAILWETIKELAKNVNSKQEQIVFITTNLHDFLHNDSIHQDLLDELKNEGVSTNVEVFTSLDGYNKKYKNSAKEETKGSIQELTFKETKDPEQEATLEEIKDELINDYNPFFSLTKQTELLIKSKLMYKELAPEKLGLHHYFESPSITSYNEENIELLNLEVKSYSATDFLIEAVYKTECEIDFFITKNDYYHLLDERDRPNVIEYNWNDYYIAASDTKELLLEVLLIIRKDFKDIKSQEITVESVIE